MKFAGDRISKSTKPSSAFTETRSPPEAAVVDLNSPPLELNETQSSQAGAAEVDLTSLPPATWIETQSSPSLVEPQTAAVELKSPAPASVETHSIQSLAEAAKVDLNPSPPETQSSQSLAGAVAVDLSPSPTASNDTQSSQTGAAAVPPPVTRIETLSSPSLVEPQTAMVELKSPALASVETHSIQSLAEAAKIDLSVPIKSTNTDHTKEKRGRKRNRPEDIVPPRVSSKSKRVRKKPDFFY